MEVQVAAASHIHHLDLIPYHAPDHDPRAGRRRHHRSRVPPVPAVSAPSVARVLPHPVAVLTRSICIVTLLVLQAHVASLLLTDLKVYILILASSENEQTKVKTTSIKKCVWQEFSNFFSNHGTFRKSFFMVS